MPYKILAESSEERKSLEYPPKSDGPRVTFLLRKDPAKTGGVQSLNNILINGLSPLINLDDITWKGAEWAFPAYFPFFFLKGIAGKASLIYCDDAVTALIGSKIRAASRKIVVSAAHGLDVTLPIPWYQKRVGAALRSLDRVITISKATSEQLKKRGISPDNIEIIPPPIPIPPEQESKGEKLYAQIESDTGIDLRQKKILISIGRPVKRKGFDVFIRDIFPHLPDDYIYIIAGPLLKTPLWIRTARPILGGSLYHNLMLASGSYSMHDDLISLSNHPRVFYLNGVSEKLRDLLYSAADLFIMPNRSVDGDMEGFGLVALEAAIRGVPVIATGIEGITDAVFDGENGFCVPEGDKGAMLGVIMALLGDPLKLGTLSRRAREFTARNFAPEKALARYCRIFEELLEKGRTQQGI